MPTLTIALDVRVESVTYLLSQILLVVSVVLYYCFHLEFFIEQCSGFIHVHLLYFRVNVFVP